MQGRAGAGAHARLSTFILLLGVATVSAIADLLSKWWVFRWWVAKEYPIGGQPYPLVKGWLAVVCCYNPGGVFGIGHGRTKLFVAVSVVTIAAIIWVYYQYGRNHVFMAAALGFLLGGAVGNLWDRVYYGKVRDFVYLHAGDRFSWFPFNAADVFICIGAGLVILCALRQPKDDDAVRREVRTEAS